MGWGKRMQYDIGPPEVFSYVVCAFSASALLLGKVVRLSKQRRNEASSALMLSVDERRLRQLVLTAASLNLVARALFFTYGLEFRGYKNYSIARRLLLFFLQLR